MKRQKIKNKYLVQRKPVTNLIEEPSMVDKINRSILRLLIALGCLLLLLIWGVVPVFLLTIVGIDYTTLNDFTRVMIAFGNDLVLICIFLGIYRKNLRQDFKNYFRKNFLQNLGCSFRYWLLGLLVMVVSNAVIAVITN